MKRVFLDTNVLLDFLADRNPFSEAAAQLFTAASQQKIRIHVSALSFSNLYYILRQTLSHTQTCKHLTALAELVNIEPVDASSFLASLHSPFNDVEDAIQYHCALAIPNIEMLVTRNTKDFKHAEIAVLTPTEAIAAC
jgi:predicted nucleic acid-binding protein